MALYYQIDLTTLYHGDCRDVLPQIGVKADLVLTSPPYDNLRDYKGELIWGEDVWVECIDRITKSVKEGGIIVWVVGDATIDGSESGTSFKQALYFKKLGFKLHDTMIWNKGSFTNPSSNRYHQVFEYMFVFSNGKPKTFNPILDRKNKYLGVRGASGRTKDGERRKGTSEVNREFGQRFNIWDISVGGNISYKGECSHPAVFPLKLAQDHILSWTNEGDTVLDPFCGSGTTLLASKTLNRKSVGIDISKDYCDITISRISG